MAYKAGDKAFFIYGFTKSAKANIKPDELKALKLYAATLFSYGNRELAIAIKAGAL